MDLIVLLSIFSAFVIIALFGLLFRYNFIKSESENVVHDEPVRPRPRIGAHNRTALRQNNRNTAGLEPRNEDVEDEDDTVDPSVTTVIDPKLGSKKRAKLEAKAEKKIKREAELQEREDRKKKQAAEEAERKAREDHEKRQEQEQLAIEKKIAEEKAKKEYDEYLKLKETFNIEEVGYEVSDEPEGTLTQFIDFIQDEKVVFLDELALRFKLKTQATIDRIQSLLEDGSLTGVIDDRGKFIYISQSELNAVASFIKKRGRVSLIELAEHSNNLIVLDNSTKLIHS